jgi:hypothetical protein
MTFLPVRFAPGELHACLRQLPQNAMLDQFEVPAAQSRETDRRCDLRRSW